MMVTILSLSFQCSSTHDAYFMLWSTQFATSIVIAIYLFPHTHTHTSNVFLLSKTAQCKRIHNPSSDRDRLEKHNIITQKHKQCQWLCEQTLCIVWCYGKSLQKKKNRLIGKRHEPKAKLF